MLLRSLALYFFLNLFASPLRAQVSLWELSESTKGLTQVDEILTIYCEKFGGQHLSELYKHTEIAQFFKNGDLKEIYAHLGPLPYKVLISLTDFVTVTESGVLVGSKAFYPRESKSYLYQDTRKFAANVAMVDKIYLSDSLQEVYLLGMTAFAFKEAGLLSNKIKDANSLKLEDLSYYDELAKRNQLSLDAYSPEKICLMAMLLRDDELLELVRAVQSKFDTLSKEQVEALAKGITAKIQFHEADSTKNLPSRFYHLLKISLMHGVIWSPLAATFILDKYYEISPPGEIYGWFIGVGFAMSGLVNMFYTPQERALLKNNTISAKNEMRKSLAGATLALLFQLKHHSEIQEFLGRNDQFNDGSCGDSFL